MSSLIFTNSSSSNGKKPWTKEQSVALIECLNQSGTREDAAAVTGHPINSITYQVRRLKAAEGALVKAGTEVTLDAVLKAIHG